MQRAVGVMETSADSQSFTAQHSWPAAAAPNHDEMPIFGWMID